MKTVVTTLNRAIDMPARNVLANMSSARRVLGSTECSSPMCACAALGRVARRSCGRAEAGWSWSDEAKLHAPTSRKSVCSHEITIAHVLVLIALQKIGEAGDIDSRYVGTGMRAGELGLLQASD